MSASTYSAPSGSPDGKAPNVSRPTPGPWEFGRTSDDHRIILGGGNSRRYVCNVQIHQHPRPYGLQDEPEREANARLILATPDLLTALLDIVRFCDDPEGSEKGPSLAVGLAGLLHAARAALAKADVRRPATPSDPNGAQPQADPGARP